MRTTKSTYPWYLLKNLLKNLLMWLMPVTINRIRRTTGTGNRQLDQDIVQLVEYSKGVFEKYCRYIAKTNLDEALKNKIIVELGPGDTIATALFFLAYGAARVICFDRFELIQNTAKNTLVAKQILSIIPEQQRRHLKNILSFDDQKQVCWDTTSLQYMHNRGENITLANDSVDIIVSNAVLEHVQNLDVLFANMHRILKPDGIMVHEVDLRSHDMHHITALDFLAVSEWLWRLMTFYRGAPNRKRWSYYKNLLDEHSFKVASFKVTNTLPPDTINEFKRLYPKQAKQFRDDDLSLGGFLFVARKP